MKSNYLKYWRVIRKYVKMQWGIGQVELDLILFLYSEDYFGKDKFDEFNNLVTWDSERFKRLLRDGWITVFRKRSGSLKTLYQLSYKASQIVDFIYENLNSSTPFLPIPRKAHYARRLKENEKRVMTYSEKVYANTIREMNKKVKADGRKRFTRLPPRLFPK